MEQMNDAMAEMNESNMFVTLFVGVLDLLTGQMRYSNAGHCPPMMVDGNDVELLQMDSNVPLGLMMKWKYTVQEAMIAPQTTLFLYTDGLTEAENSAHELFGEERMIDTGRKNSDVESSEDLLSAMNDAVRAFVDGNEQSDDLTMLALRFTKNQAVIKLQRSLTLPNDVNAVPQLASFVDDVCEQLDIDPSTNMSLNLALEEAVVNVMKYAYPEGTKGEVHIDAKASDKRLRITITDSGIPFDPTAQREADTSLSVEERPIGGLGIYLVRQLMDSINYNRVDGKNVLTLLKKLG
jgi:sigma-B regulation protein RsbU (phosphoserine phosphatase)